MRSLPPGRSALPRWWRCCEAERGLHRANGPHCDHQVVRDTFCCCSRASAPRGDCLGLVHQVIWNPKQPLPTDASRPIPRFHPLHRLRRERLVAVHAGGDPGEGDGAAGAVAGVGEARVPDGCVLSEHGSNSRSAQTKEQCGTRHQEQEQEHDHEHEHDEQKQPRGVGRTKIAASPASTSNGTWLGIAVCGSSSSPIFSL